MQLRGNAGRRRRVDPGLAGGLREWLEDGLAAAANALPAGAPPVVVGPRSLRVVAADPTRGTPDLTLPVARGALVEAVFRLLVTGGHVGDPVAEAAEALAVDRRGAAVLAFVEGLAPAQRASLHAEVVGHAAALRTGWPTIPPSWLPRTRDRISVPVAAGRVVLTGGIDLALGSPSAGRASVCLVTLASGPRHRAHRADRHYRGLLETLRSGAPPARLATFYTPPCEVDAEDVEDQLLAAAVQRTIDGAVELCRRAADR